MQRKNINRGFKSLRVWQDTIQLYVLSFRILSKLPFELKKTASNSIDAATAYQEILLKVIAVEASKSI